MANYFRGGGNVGSVVPQGFLASVNAANQNMMRGVNQFAEGISEGIEKYRKNKEKREILTEKGEWVAERKMEDLANWVDADPQRMDTKEYEEKLKDVQKFNEGIADMPLGKLESAISNYALDIEIDERRQSRLDTENYRNKTLEQANERIDLAERELSNTETQKKEQKEQENAFVEGMGRLSGVPTTVTEEVPGFNALLPSTWLEKSPNATADASAKPAYKWIPPTTKERTLTPQERYAKIQEIEQTFGPKMGAELLSKFRNVSTQYDPNAPSPIRETEGKSGQEYYYNIQSKASGLVPNKNAISSTERAGLQRIAANKERDARKEQTKAKENLGNAIDELEALKADPVPEEGKIKAAEKKVARLRAALDEVTDLGIFRPLEDDFVK